MGVGSYLIRMNNLIEKIKKARFIWIAGNGGSAATAEHFATDLVKKGYRAVALSSNTSIITMIANDYGYDQIFSKQLLTYASKHDLLITISCSGTSENIDKVKLVARNKEIPTYNFETFDKDKYYGLLEDKHLAFAHAVTEAL